jgi:DNA-3-methyladenine glycosylase II
MNPDYWQQAKDELSNADSVLATLIARYGGEALASRGEPFATLVRSIVGQQISVKAADAVWARVLAVLAGVPTPAAVLAADPQALAASGLSRRKFEYLTDLAAHFRDGRVDPARWRDLDDQAIIDELCAVRGIGRWTAEMFLIFNLLRPDVLPLDDIGVHKALAASYCAGKRPDRQTMLAIAAPWRPWRTVATWYLWRSLDPLPVAY